VLVERRVENSTQASTLPSPSRSRLPRKVVIEPIRLGVPIVGRPGRRGSSRGPPLPSAGGTHGGSISGSWIGYISWFLGEIGVDRAHLAASESRLDCVPWAARARDGRDAAASDFATHGNRKQKELVLPLKLIAI
jgi:hypothetical protein